MLSRRTRLARAASLGVLVGLGLAACGGDTATPTPTAKSGPVKTTGPGGTPVYFSDRDTPYEHATKELQTFWQPYDVGTIPGIHALDSELPAPRVINLTNDVPDALAQQWGHSFMHTAAWEKWAIGASQPGLLGRLGRDATIYQNDLLGGGIVTRPDCDLFPTQLMLMENDPKQNNQTSQYAFVASYAGPNGTECAVTNAQPGSPALKVRSFVNDIEIVAGWMHVDPVLGNVWLGDTRDQCAIRCPAPPATGVLPVGSPPALPDSDTVATDASPALQQAWAGYNVTIIPGASAAKGIPSLPTLDNQTGGAVTSDQATTMEIGLFQDLAWLRWSWRTTQIPFQAHIAGRTYPNLDLRRYGAGGAHAQLPECAAFPKTVTLKPNTKSDRNNSSAANITQYHFDLTYDDKCKAQAILPDGHSKDVHLFFKVTIYGDLRNDPLLGTVWVPLEEVQHDKT